MGLTIWEADKILEDGGAYRSGTSMSKADLELLKAQGVQGLPIKGGTSPTHQNDQTQMLNGTDLYTNIASQESTLMQRSINTT
jgi:hypothetical protein